MPFLLSDWEVVFADSNNNIYYTLYVKCFLFFIGEMKTKKIYV